MNGMIGKGSKVCVVGGAGFLGSHLVDHLVNDRDCDVTVIDNLVIGQREWINAKAKFIYADITASETYLYQIFKSLGIEWTFNYAAHPYIPDSFARPLHVCDVNFMGACKVINAAQEAGCKGILQVSSAEIYGGVCEKVDHTAADKPSRGVVGQKINELDEVSPHSSYGVSKAAVDNFVQVRWREAKTPCIALRQFNCVGPRESHPYVVPEIISQLSKQFVETKFTECKTCAAKPGMPVLCDDCLRRRHTAHRTSSVNSVVRLGNNSFRDFLYAGDQARMACELLERGQFGEVYNLGSETGIKIYDLAKLIGKLMGFKEVEVIKDEARVRPWEIWHLQSDNGKINAVLKKCGHGHCADDPKLVSLEEALQKTIGWFIINGYVWPWE